MQACKLTYFCKTSFRCLLCLIASVSFLIGAIVFDARKVDISTSVTARSSSPTKSFLAMIADAEEEVESSENNQSENFDGDAAGEFLFCGTYVRYKTALPVFNGLAAKCTGGRPVLHVPLYVLFNCLKVFHVSTF